MCRNPYRIRRWTQVAAPGNDWQPEPDETAPGADQARNATTKARTAGWTLAHRLRQS